MFSCTAAHISFEEELYATSEAEGSVIVNVCVSVLTGPVIESLTVNVDLMSSSATGKYITFKM